MNTKQKTKSFMLSIAFLIIFTLLLGILSQLKYLFPPKLERFTYGFIGLISAITTIWIFLKLEKKSFYDIGLVLEKSTFKKFLMGLLIGILIATLMTFTQISISGLEITLLKDSNIISFIFCSSALIPLAFMEEIAFRSYPFIKLNKAFGFRTAQFIIAILFAIYHILNGWSIVMSFIGPGILALVFGLSAKISNGISLPTGLHYGLNLFLAAISSQKGIKGLFIVDFPTEVSKTITQQNTNVGLGIHIFILIICLIITEFYLRNKTKSTKTVNN